MKRSLLLILCSLIILNISGQSNKHKYIGTNVIGITTSTLSVNYNFEIKPYLSPLLDIGYTFNYAKTIDFIGTALTPHSKWGNYGLELNKQSGPFIRLGTFLNLRKTYDKENYLHFGLFLINSIINEECTYLHIEEPGFMLVPVQVRHTKYIFGLSASIGYEFALSKKVKSNFDFQVAFPDKNYKNLYGYRNYIPGMGFKDFEGYWFPMLIWNLKYRI